MAPGRQPEVARTLRATSGIVSLVVAALLALFLLGDAVVRAGWGRTLLLAPWVLLGLWAVYELTFASVVRVDAQGAVVQNMLRRTSFGWARVRDVDFRWQLVFSLDDGRDVTCLGGPAKARPVRRHSQDGAPAAAPAGVRELTEIRDLWQAAPQEADAPIRRSWDGPALIALAVIAVWAAASVLIANG